MKIFDKKITLGIGLTTLFIVSSCVYSLGYRMAMNKLNSIVSYTNEKQKIYNNLSTIDDSIRDDYIGNIDEYKILNGISSGYFSGLEDSNCRLLNKSEYQEYLKNIENYQAEISWDEFENQKIGYLSCKTFGKGLSDLFLERLDYFNSKGINKIIIDLRLSEEGNVDEVFKILQYLLPENHGLYSVNKSGNKEIACQSLNNNDNNFEFLILTSKKTSGCSEILSLSLQDSLNAEILGESTIGNTIKEKIVGISEDSIIIYPNAKYVTFNGEDIYKKGLTPDNEINISENDMELLKENKLSYEDDKCVQKAIDILST